MNSTCAVVVTYNRLNLLRECLHHLLEIKEHLDNIIVVNNNSTDGTCEFLAKLSKENSKIILKNLDSNVGGAKGFELGLKEAVAKTNCQYFWIMDDDTIVRNDSLEPLISAFSLDEKIGFVCSNVRWKDERAINIPTVTSDWPEKINYNLIKVKRATFVSLLLTRDIVNEVGLPIGELFIWGDDTEYTTRISSKYPCFYVADSIVDHKSNLTTTTIFNAPDAIIPRYFYSYRNNLFIAKKYVGTKTYIKKFIKTIILSLKVLLNADNRRFKRFCIILKSCIKSLTFSPKIPYVK